MATAKKVTMDELLASAGDIKQLTAGDTVEGVVMSVKKHEILIDLGANGVGMIPRREAAYARNLEVGEKVAASVIDAEMPDGTVLLSMRKAVKDKGWDEIMEKVDADETVEMQTAAVCSLSTRGFAGSCQFRNFRQNTTRVLVRQIKMRFYSGSTRWLVRRSRYAFWMRLRKTIS